LSDPLTSRSFAEARLQITVAQTRSAPYVSSATLRIVVMQVELTLPFPMPSETTLPFGVALHEAVRTSLQSMDDLHDCIKPCVRFLHAAGVGPAQMILTIKDCVRQSALSRRALGHEFAVANADQLMEQIVKWAIVEYYRIPA
jgi:hypothetical protein